MARFGFGDLLLCAGCTACFTAALSTPPPSTTYVVIDRTDAVLGQSVRQVHVGPGGSVASVASVGVPSLQHLSR